MTAVNKLKKRAYKCLGCNAVWLTYFSGKKWVYAKRCWSCRALDQMTDDLCVCGHPQDEHTEDVGAWNHQTTYDFCECLKYEE